MDDDVHNPDPDFDKMDRRRGGVFTLRGFQNLGCIGVLLLFVGALL